MRKGSMRRYLAVGGKLFLLWILLFDFQRIIFSIHNWDKLKDVALSDWLLTLFYSLRLDIATAAYLSVLPVIAFLIYYIKPAVWTKHIFKLVVFTEAVLCIMIHVGEVNAYTEWGHKLTGRVFMHLSNPDEVVRTADYAMVFWFLLYGLLEFMFFLRFFRWFFTDIRENTEVESGSLTVASVSFISLVSCMFLLARGGLQPIPLNINSAFFSNNHVINDISANSTYYFGNSYLLFSKADIDAYMPEMDIEESRGIVKELYAYKKEHTNLILKDERPNIVVVVLESWAAEAIGTLSENKGATPNFDALCKEGLLFTNVYATSRTSETGNVSIFSGYPALPEISIALQPEKHRKLKSFNQELAEWGYSSHYLFSGDLKYGNIGGFLQDHGFNSTDDENDFPGGLERGKLNYYDEDLYKFFIDRIDKTKGKFMHCAFTGSTHSPYDHPKTPGQNWKGTEADFMNSMVYADKCLGDFVKNCQKKKWFDNTLFIFVADHGHATPTAEANSNDFYRVPLLLWGNQVKDDYKGVRIDKLGSQIDIPATLMYQMGGDISSYPWSKDLMNPEAPEFAFHTIVHGYGWITSKGEVTYQMEQKKYMHSTFPEGQFDTEMKKGQAFIVALYDEFKKL